MDSQKEFVSTREAAQMLGVALRTVQLWVENGSLIAWKTAGGHRRIVRSSVQAMLAAQQRALDASHRERQLEVLVVDDDKDLQQLYDLQISHWPLPIRLHQAYNGFEGLRLLGEVKPDVLITDLNMPGMDGFQMLREVCSWPASEHMLIIAISALPRSALAERGGLPAMVRFFPAPAPFDTLLELVTHLHESRKPARAGS